MAFERPTLQTLIDRAKSDIKSRTQGDPFLRRAFERVLAKAMAGLTHGLYGYLAWIAKQVIPSTSDEDMLLPWGRVFGVARKAAAKATGTATLTGTNGTTIPEGTELQLADGTLFVSTADAAVSSGSASVSVRASVAGADGNADAGAKISLTGPIAGIDSDGVVASGGLSGGSDEEDIEDYRTRLLLRIQTPPRGGAEGDYVTWALEVAGVTRAWEFPHRMGVGTMALTFVRDDDDDLIPDAGEVATVQEYVDGKAPADIRSYSNTQRVFVFAPVAHHVTMTVAIAPNTAAVQDAVKASIADLFLREAEPEESTPLLSRIDEAISTATGETDHEITAIDSLAPGTGGLNVFDPSTDIAFTTKS